MHTKYAVLAGWMGLLGLVACAPSAQADMYVTGEGGLTTHEIPYYDQSSTFSVGVGVVGPARMLGVEASYVNLGNGAIGLSPYGNISMSGYNVSTIFQSPAGPYVYGLRLGFYSMNSTDSGYGNSVSSSGLSWGAYLGVRPNDSMLIIWDTQGYSNVLTPNDGYETPTTVSLGVRYYFGVRPMGYRRFDDQRGY
jgi:hypothetical protein